MKKLLGFIILCIPLYVFGLDDSSTDSEFDENPVISKVIKVIQGKKYEKNKPNQLFIEGSGGVGFFLMTSVGYSGNFGIELERFQLYVGGGYGEITSWVNDEKTSGTYLSSGIRYIYQDVGAAKGLFGIQGHYYIKQEGNDNWPISLMSGGYLDGEGSRIGACLIVGGPDFITIRAFLDILIPL